jgi:hypothetical protein
MKKLVTMKKFKYEYYVNFYYTDGEIADNEIVDAENPEIFDEIDEAIEYGNKMLKENNKLGSFSVMRDTYDIKTEYDGTDGVYDSDEAS